MMAGTFTRFQAALLGCGLAVVSCLITPASHLEVPPHGAFELPETLGSWELLEQGNLQQSELEILHASDHWRRVYRCRETNKTVVVTLVAGASGPLASHQPEICYARSEFFAHGDALLWTVPERSDQFWLRTLEPRQFEQRSLTIAYAWHDGERWMAPRIPRLQLAGRATLQRLQITMRHRSGMAPAARIAIQQFAQLAVDAVDIMQSRPAPVPTPHFTLTDIEVIGNKFITR